MKDITGYGNFLWSNFTQSTSQRHKLYKRFGLRCLISPQYYNQSHRLSLALHGYALDNGAYIDYKKGTTFNIDRFYQMVKEWGSGADFIVIPDIVQNKEMTLSISWVHISKLRQAGYAHKLLFVYQDGMTASDLHPYVCQGIGIFIGGSTKAKIQAIPWISELCLKFGSWCHVGRVNTKQRVRFCIDYGVSSFDGSGWSRFVSTMTRLEDIETDYQLSLFERTKDERLLVNFSDRCAALNLEKSDVLDFWDSIQKTDTLGVGLSKRSTKKERDLLL